MVSGGQASELRVDGRCGAQDGQLEQVGVTPHNSQMASACR